MGYIHASLTFKTNSVCKSATLLYFRSNQGTQSVFFFIFIVAGELVWSKLESGRLPSIHEFKGLVEDQTVSSVPMDSDTIAQFAS